MNSRKLILLASVLLVVCQFGWAQYGPTNASQVQALALRAQQTGRPAPLVTGSAPGHHRPFVWVAAQLSHQTSNQAVKGLPSFCNVFRNGVTGFQYCPNAMQGVLGVNNVLAANGG